VATKKLIETVNSIPPFQYGDTVQWLSDSGELLIGSIVGFEQLDVKIIESANALIELPNSETVLVPLAKLRSQ
jgi:hypothetical protein